MMKALDPVLLPGRRSMVLVAALVLLACVGVSSVHEIESHIRGFESWIAQLGPLGMLAFVGFSVIGMSMLLPEAIFGVAAGVLFGIGWGIAAMLLANLLAAALQYSLSYRLLRDPVQRILGARLKFGAIQRAVMHDDLRLQLLLRLVPMNPASISYLLGAAGVRFTGFMVSCVALVPNIFLEVYLGHAGKHLTLIGAGGTQLRWQHDLWLFIGLLATIIAVAVGSRIAHKAMLRAIRDEEGAN